MNGSCGTFRQKEMAEMRSAIEKRIVRLERGTPMFDVGWLRRKRACELTDAELDFLLRTFAEDAAIEGRKALASGMTLHSIREVAYGPDLEPIFWPPLLQEIQASAFDGDRYMASLYECLDAHIDSGHPQNAGKP
jgi:hypothetical protein